MRFWHHISTTTQYHLDKTLCVESKSRQCSHIKTDSSSLMLAMVAYFYVAPQLEAAAKQYSNRIFAVVHRALGLQEQSRSANRNRLTTLLISFHNMFRVNWSTLS